MKKFLFNMLLLILVIIGLFQTGFAQDVPSDWTCDQDWYTDDSCDCGCGVVDPACSDNLDSSCTYCDSCSPTTNCADVVQDTQNWNCEGVEETIVDSGVPSDWTCDQDWYGDGECDCGCGVIDSDCSDSTDTSCNYCDSCNPISNCEDVVQDTQNWNCEGVEETEADSGVLSGWTCVQDWYGDSECDCGCGVVDVDCSDSLDTSCQYCDACNPTSDCAGVVQDTQNWKCGGVDVSCFDGIENGDETDVDCGGSECQSCPNLAQCSGSIVDVDSDSNNCGMCGSTCDSSSSCNNGVCIKDSVCNSNSECGSKTCRNEGNNCIQSNPICSSTGCSLNTNIIENSICNAEIGICSNEIQVEGTESYDNFLILLKENYIININGIRNDSSVQHMSINLIEGNVVEEENDDATILFEIEQETIEDMFQTSSNLGQSFFERVVSGEIRMLKNDNRGVLTTVGDWVGSFFSADIGFNETIPCPNFTASVCGEDGKTYKNGCFANKANIEVSHDGACLIALNLKANSMKGLNIEKKLPNFELANGVCVLDDKCFDFNSDLCSKLSGSFEEKDCDIIYSMGNEDDWELESEKVLLDETFVVSNESDVLGMFGEIIKAREDGLVAQNIWDNFGVGVNFDENVHLDGRIDLGAFVGELPGNGKDTDLGIGSDLGGKTGSVDSEFDTGRGTVGDPTGTGLNPTGTGGFMEDGFGNSYDTGMGYGSDYSTGAGSGGDMGGYAGQMGSDGGTDYADTGAGGSMPGNSGSNSADVVWSVDATHSSSSHSGPGGFSSFSHHQESVSNNQGYSSTTDKQSTTNEDGTSITKVVVTQTQSDGSSKTSETTTTTDSDGNSHTTQTYTEKDSDGEVTKEKTTETNNPPKDGDDKGCQPADDGYNDNSAPPGNYEKGMAVWNAVIKGSLAGGRGDDRTGQDNGLELGDFNPDTVGCEDGGCTGREVGGKINTDLFNPGNIDPTGAGR